MANPALVAGRVWFENKLRETANNRNVPIDEVSWSDENSDSSFIVVKSGDKKPVKRRIRNLPLEGNKPNKTLLMHIEEIVDSLIADSG